MNTLFRNTDPYELQYPGPPKNPLVTFKMVPLSWKARKQIANVGVQYDNKGNAFLASGTMDEIKIENAVVGWDLFDEDGPAAFTKERLFDLDMKVLRFLVKHINTRNSLGVVGVDTDTDETAKNEQDVSPTP
jgi:hypothetical protein